MILPTTEWFSSLQTSITDGNSSSPELDLMAGGSHSYPAQNFDSTLDETLSNEYELSTDKEVDIKFEPSGCHSSAPFGGVHSPVQAGSYQSLKVQTDKMGLDANKDLKAQTVSQVERTAVNLEHHGELSRQSNHKDLADAPNRQTSQSAFSSSNFEGRSSVVPKDGQVLGAQELGPSMPAKTDAKQHETLVNIQKVDFDERTEKLNQHANQFKVQMSAAAQNRQLSSVHESVLSNGQQKSPNHSQRKTDEMAVRTALQTSSEGLQPITDSRQGNIPMPNTLGQVTKPDTPTLEQSVMQDMKLVKGPADEVLGKSSHHEAKVDKQAQAIGFLESSHSQSFLSNKGASGTINQSTPILTQRIVDTIQMLKHSHNAQRVSFELDLAQGEKLKVRLQLSGGQVKSVFTTDSTTLKHLIRENWEQLQRQVEVEGFDLVQPEFADRNPQQAYDAEDQMSEDASFQADLKKSALLDQPAEKKHLESDPVNQAADNVGSKVVRYA